MKGRFIAMFLLAAHGLSAQQDVHLDRITISGGISRYIGEIQQQWNTVDPQYSGYTSFGYQRFLGYGTAIYGRYNYARLQGNDLDGGNIQRGLNFLTDIHAAELGFRTYLDNGSLLNYDARFAPFLSIGIGYGTYTTKVDQYDASGARYNYWTDGTVRDLPQNDPNAELAVITGQNGGYRKDVTDLATEADKPTKPNYFYIPAQLGLKWRISSRFSLDLAYGFNWTFTDHLDDISGAYPVIDQDPDLAYLSDPTGHTGPRGDPSSNDHYHQVSLGLAFSFNRRSHHYRMSPVYVDSDVIMEPKEPAPSRPIAPPAPAFDPPISTKQDTLRVRYLVIEQLIVDTIIVRSKVVPDTLGTTAMQDTTIVKADTLAKAVLQPDSSKVKSSASEAAPSVAADTAMTRTVPPVQKLRTDSASTDPEKVPATPALSDSLRTKDQGALVPTSTKGTVPGDDAPTVPKANDNASDRTSGNIPQQTSATSNSEKSTTVIPVPIPIGMGKKKEIRALEDSLARMREEQQRLEAQLAAMQKDTTGTLMDTTLVPTDSTAIRADRNVAMDTTLVSMDTTLLPSSTVLLDHQRQVNALNSMLLDRIGLMELYISMQDQEAPDSVQNALELKVRELDAQVEALRDSLRMERAATTVSDSNSTVHSDKAHTAVERVHTDTLLFSSGSRNVQAQDIPRLKQIAADFKEKGKGQMIITGHSDRSGQASFNLTLSQQRAEAVAKILEQEGVPVAAMRTKGLGEKLARSTYNVRERNVVVQMVLME